MADGTLPLNGVAVPGGETEDVEALNILPPAPPPPPVGFISVIRQRLQVVGRLYSQIAAVLNADPSLSDYGLVVRPIVARSATESTVQIPASIVTVPLLAANPLRKQAMFQTIPILTGGTLQLFFGASLIATVEMVPGAYYELPEPVWDGAISGVWDAAIGSVLITELS